MGTIEAYVWEARRKIVAERGIVQERIAVVLDFDDTHCRNIC